MQLLGLGSMVRLGGWAGVPEPGGLIWELGAGSCQPLGQGLLQWLSLGASPALPDGEWAMGSIPRGPPQLVGNRMTMTTQYGSWATPGGGLAHKSMVAEAWSYLTNERRPF